MTPMPALLLHTQVAEAAIADASADATILRLLHYATRRFSYLFC